MRIVCIGGGPAGLYFGLLMKKENPAHQVTVVERNRPYDTFGWGVVFSDATMENMRAWDAETAHAIESAFNHWDDIEVLIKGRRMRTTGHGFVGIGRKKLLNILQARCEELGVELVFEREVDSDLEFPDADLIIASDGINSKIRNRYAGRVQARSWSCGRTASSGSAPTSSSTPSPSTSAAPSTAGSRRISTNSTTHFDLHRRDDGRRLQGARPRRGRRGSDRSRSARSCSAKCSTARKLMSNARHLRGSAWLNFSRLICGKWSHFNGAQPRRADGRRRAHRAFRHRLGHQARARGRHRADQAIPGARRHAGQNSRGLAAYEEVRAVDVARIQNAARNAMEWFEVVGSRYADTLEPEQFMYSLLTRSQRISHENLRLRDKTWLEGYERWFAARSGVNVACRRTAGAADVHAVSSARRHACQTASWSRRWRCIRPSTACRTIFIWCISAPRPRRRRPGVRRDDLRVAGRAHHAGLPWPVERRADGGMETHRRFRPHDNVRQDRPAARPCRPQGLDAARLGRYRPAAGRRQLAADFRLARCLI